MFRYKADPPCLISLTTAALPKRTPPRVFLPAVLAALRRLRRRQGELLVITRGDFNNIYRMPCGDLCDETTATTSAGPSGTLMPLGCFTDVGDDRIFSGEMFSSGNMTSEVKRVEASFQWLLLLLLIMFFFRHYCCLWSWRPFLGKTRSTALTWSFYYKTSASFPPPCRH